MQPHRPTSFKFSTDPFCVERVRDIVGLVPESARPGAGPVRGRQEPSAGAGGHPTAATDGDRLCRRVHPPPWHHHAVRGARRTRRFGHHPVQAAPSPPGIPRVSQTLFARKVPTGLDVHLIADHSTTHKHAKVKAWLASPSALSSALHADLCEVAQEGRPLVRTHHPTAIRCGSLRSGKELVQKVQAYVTNYNLHRRSLGLDCPR